MIAITNPTPIDIMLARQLYGQSRLAYDLPNRKTLFTELVAYDQRGMIAYGGVELVPEGFIIVDERASAYSRAKAIKNIIDAGERRLKEFNFRDLLTFTSDEATEKYLLQLGFSKVKESVLTRGIK